jgi:hypothetical protein
MQKIRKNITKTIMILALPSVNNNHWTVVQISNLTYPVIQSITGYSFKQLLTSYYLT